MIRTAKSMLAAICMLSCALPGMMTSVKAQQRQAQDDKAADRVPALEQLIRIPREGTASGMLTRICRPAGSAPAPLVVVNHGSPSDPAQRPTRRPTSCGEVAQFFTSRGYVVAFPLRRGYGETGGVWAETFGRCEQPDFYAGGQATADDIAAAIAHVENLPFVAKGGTVVVGQSAGGWGALALAARNPDGVRTYINFAGGRGARIAGPGRFSNCAPEVLESAAATYGKATRQASLWIYTENDLLFPKALAESLHEAYTTAGGQVRFELLAAFGSNGHDLFFASGGSRIWGPVVDRWLTEVNAGGAR